MERLDKFIGSQTEFSRKDVKRLINQKRITVNGKFIRNSDFKIDIMQDDICIDGNKINFQEHVYLVLNKPKGYISATEDKIHKTVLDLVPEKYLHRELFPAGRLDKDTTGLMIITDDGEFVHKILAPKKHVSKIYEVTIDIPISQEMINGFTDGVKLNDGECKTAVLEKVDENFARVTLTEGRYHQIKRMFGCYGAKVTELHRIQIGNFKLPSNLKLGECIELTEKELQEICK